MVRVLRRSFGERRIHFFAVFLLASLLLHGSLFFFVFAKSSQQQAPSQDASAKPVEPAEAFALLGQAIEVTQEELGDDVMNLKATPAEAMPSIKEAALPAKEIAPSAQVRENAPSSSTQKESHPGTGQSQKAEVLLDGASDDSVAERKKTQLQSSPEVRSKDEASQPPNEQGASAGEAAPDMSAGALGAQAVKEGRAQLLRAFAKTLPQAAAGHQGLKEWSPGMRFRAEVKLEVDSSGRLKKGEVLSSESEQLTSLLKKNFLFLRRGRYGLSLEQSGVQRLALRVSLKSLQPSSRFEPGVADLSEALGIIESPNPDEFRTPRGAYLRMLSGRYFEFLIKDISPQPALP